MKETLTVRLPRDLRAALERICRSEKTPVSDAVRESIRRYVAVRQFRALRRRILPHAEAHGFLTDEDVFKAIS